MNCSSTSLSLLLLAEGVTDVELAGLPATSNADMRVDVHAADLNLTIWRRLMRAPPPATAAGAVQVDHSTMALRVNEDGGSVRCACGGLPGSSAGPLDRRSRAQHSPTPIDAGHQVEVPLLKINGIAILPFSVRKNNAILRQRLDRTPNHQTPPPGNLGRPKGGKSQPPLTRKPHLVSIPFNAMIDKP